jgi:hypothetical protein
MRLIRLVPFALLFGLSPACGGDSEGDRPAAVPLEELPAKYAAALCTVFENCYGDLLQVFQPGEDCVTNFSVRAEEELATLPDAIDAGRVKYDGTKVQACLDEITSADCSFLSERDPASCEAVFEGTVEEGGDCQRNEECQGEQYCNFADACPGICSAREQAGGACTGNSDCADGLKCGEASLCVKPSAAGEACKGGEPDCIDGYFCVGNDDAMNMPGECKLFDEAFPGKLGDACSLAALCEIGLSCNITSIAPVEGECVEKVGSGDACGFAVPDQCPDDEYCTGVTLLAPGTCTSKPEAGEDCGTNQFMSATVCAPYARCDEGVCRELAHLGETCTVNGTCYSGSCVNNGCVPSDSCND